MYNKDDIVYILENDQVVRKAKVAGRSLYRSVDRFLRCDSSAGKPAV